jgi:outer membrane protein assembly factor BamB
MTVRRAVLPLILMGAGLAQAQAPGWPQWGGPTRDFKASAGRLAASWPSGGPREVWSRDLGEGYSAVTMDGGTLYTMYRPVKGIVATVLSKFTGSAEEPEVVAALDAATGETRWEHSYQAPAVRGMNMEYGPGPHSTPLVLRDVVVAVGVTGKLHALDKRSGAVVWAHDLYSEYGGKVQGRGYSCSPLAYGDTVIVTVGGGSGGKALMAFRQKDGSVAWKNGDYDPSPASPLLINVDGQDQVVLFHADGVAGVSPQDGSPLWTQAHRTDYGLNISLPVWGEGNLLFVSSAYGAGSRGLRLSQAGGRTTVKELWFNPKMRLHLGNAVRVGDMVYGSSGDFGPAFFTAIDARTGTIAWQERGFSRASSVWGDGKLVILDEDGTLALATPDAQGLNVRSKAEVLARTAWTVPTLVGTRLYLRDRATIKALELGS